MAADLSTAAALRNPENGPNMVAAALTETEVRRTTTPENGRIAAGRLCQLCHTGESSQKNSEFLLLLGMFYLFFSGVVRFWGGVEGVSSIIPHILFSIGIYRYRLSIKGSWIQIHMLILGWYSIIPSKVA